VKLETTKIGGTTVTSVEALRRFSEALARQNPDRPPPTQHERHTEDAERELVKLGI
jgi:hypothetical protein